jgi:hypothetical protein
MVKIMNELENPAKRLYTLLSVAKKQDGKKRVGEVWAFVLGIEASNQGELLVGIADVIHLVDKVKRSITSLDDANHGLLLERFGNVETLFANLNLNQTWEHGQRYLDETTMYSLRVCSDVLSRDIGNKEISVEELQKLQSDVEDLLNTVLSTDFDAELRSVLIENLEAIRRSIIGYRINGVDGMRQALEKSLGAVFLNQKLREELLKKENGNQFVQKFQSILGSLGRLVVESTLSAALEAGIGKFLLG